MAISILLADDDDDDCFIFQEVLNEIGCNAQLFTVNDGMELMRYLQVNHLPEVLFLDLNMPKKNGFECLTEIKSKPDLQTLPVIIFSTSFDDETIAHLYQNGATYFIQKPSDFKELKQVISTALEQICNGIPFDRGSYRAN